MLLVLFRHKPIDLIISFFSFFENYGQRKYRLADRFLLEFIPRGDAGQE